MSYLHTICYGDTDAGGVVYFATYLRLCEEAWLHFLKQRGWDLSAMHTSGMYLTVKRVEADYLTPARFGEKIEIVTRIHELSRASFWFRHVLRNPGDSTLYATVRNQMVAVDTSGKLRRLPLALKEILMQDMEKSFEKR